MTLVDFPGRVAATVFTRGCNFRCGFCHNPELAIPEEFNPLLDEDEIFRLFESRLGKLQGVCITGGEPTIQKDIREFISHIKALGFDVKLDSNGSRSEVLEKIIKDGDLDYIAMDIKSPIDKYQLVTNFQGTRNPPTDEVNKIQISSKSQKPKKLPSTDYSPMRKDFAQRIDSLQTNIRRSIDLIMNSGIDYEFRTTVMKPYLLPKDFEGIGNLIKGAKKFYIQNFVASKQIDPNIKFEPFSDQDLEQSLKTIKKYVKNAKIR